MKKLLIILCFTLCFSSFCRISAAAAPDITVPSAILMDQATGTVLYEQNADEKRAPASVTKVMTMLLIEEALESGKLRSDQLIPVSAEAVKMGGSQVYLKEGEAMTADEMLKCIAVASANDCCVAMAEAIAGSVSGFIDLMNARAAELEMDRTHFASCTGLDTEDHYTTARDIARMSRALMEHPDIQKYTTIWMDSIRGGDFGLSNTNKLIRFYDGATGLKTGYTSQAGYCLSATAERDGLALIAVVLGGATSDERFSDAKALLNYGFSQYAVYREDPALPAPVTVIKGEAPSVQPLPATPPVFLTPKGSEENISYTVELPADVYAPVEAGQKLGVLRYSLKENEIGIIDLIAAEAVPRISFGTLLLKTLKIFFTV